MQTRCYSLSRKTIAADPCYVMEHWFFVCSSMTRRLLLILSSVTISWQMYTSCIYTVNYFEVPSSFSSLPASSSWPSYCLYHQQFRDFCCVAVTDHTAAKDAPAFGLRQSQERWKAGLKVCHAESTLTWTARIPEVTYAQLLMLLLVVCKACL